MVFLPKYLDFHQRACFSLAKFCMSVYFFSSFVPHGRIGWGHVGVCKRRTMEKDKRGTSYPFPHLLTAIIVQKCCRQLLHLTVLSQIMSKAKHIFLLFTKKKNKNQRPLNEWRISTIEILMKDIFGSWEGIWQTAGLNLTIWEFYLCDILNCNGRFSLENI